MDKRSRKTQEAITRAFTELIREKGGISKVSVRDIAGRTNISRSTFYSHYNDIDELSELLTESCATELSGMIRDHASHYGSVGSKEELEKLFLAILLYLRDQDPIAREVLVNSRTSGVNDGIADTVAALLQNYYEDQGISADPEVLNGAAIFLSHGVSGMIQDWFRSRENPPVHQTAAKMASAVDTIITLYSQAH